MTDGRAVSDTVGFVLVFSLVLLSVAGVSVAGMSGLSDRQDAEQLRNVERAFDVLSDNLRDVQRFEDPSRATEMRLGGGTLGFGEEVTVSVAVYNDTGAVVGEATERRLHPIVYRKGDSAVVYEGGALVRVDDGGSHLFDEPAFVVDEAAGRGALPFVVTRDADERTAVGGEGTVLVGADWSGVRPAPDPLEANTSDGETIRVSVTSPRADAWARYFEEHESFTDVEQSGETVSARIEAETVYASAVRVAITLRR